jgi:anti-anti-sigma regulatory factor
VVDLSGVDLLASAAVRVLFAARDEHRTHGNRLTIVVVQGSPAEQVLDLVGLEHELSTAEVPTAQP